MSQQSSNANSRAASPDPVLGVHGGVGDIGAVAGRGGSLDGSRHSAGPDGGAPLLARAGVGGIGGVRGGRRDRTYGEAMRAMEAARGSPGTSIADGEMQIRIYWGRVLDQLDVPGLRMDQVDSFKLALAADAIRNLSSMRGIGVHQQYVMFADLDIQVDRREFYGWVFNGNLDDSYLTRLHRGVLKEIRMLLGDPVARELFVESGIKDLDTRMDYLGMAKLTRVPNRAARETAVRVALAEAQEV